ncbi:DUF58 domain-containing protein [Roseivirga misakiensis]|uniref:Cell division protein FtsB n=1 Tax=Roseivirga misakiensis TaxID=1563681 RepID=A0A1E5T3I8_9BACT|nr:DUF58 domain-containing protein [Roseivirga misakiensis]OEK05948.1 cell division protein FtsB [Roseivirga misakiensis]
MNFYRSIYLTNRFFYAAGFIIFLFVVGFAFPFVTVIAEGLFYLAIACILIDVLLLYRTKDGIQIERLCTEKFSNGDDNPIRLIIENLYPITLDLEVIDELPEQLQVRDQVFELSLTSGEVKEIHYKIRPTKRGEYAFGVVNVFISTFLSIVRRRYQLGDEKNVAVYPSFIQMRKYELLAISNQLQSFGVKKIRRIGNNMEFEQIKNYVSGDDYRKVNWKATARKNQLMVNQYQDERSQQVYSVIDKGRVMKMPFESLSLLDYAINSSLVISNIALKKGDKAGIITFQHKVNSLLPASARNMQLNLILEHLYKQKTGYKETDYSKLYITLKRKVTQRSLILLYTNFESVSALKRQLPFLRKIRQQHLLVCIFFQNTEVDKLIDSPANDIEEVYTKGIAEQLSFEKKLIVKELKAHGIHSILTPPKELSVNTINKYLELKSRGLI